MSGVDDILAFQGRFGGCVVRLGDPDRSAERPASPRHDPLAVRGETGVAATLGDDLAKGGLHEWFGVAASAVDAPDAPNRGAYRDWIPPLLPLVQGMKQAPSRADGGHWTIWIGRRCFPYGKVLVGADGDRRSLEGSIFVPTDRPGDRLWAVDLALRCPAVGVVIADGSGFDMAATRRVQLVARTNDTPAWLVRPPWEVNLTSAAQTRRWVRWESRSDGSAEDEADVLNARWRIELLRCKGGQPERRPRVRVVEWDRGQGALRVLAPLAGATGDAGTVPGARQRVQA